MNLLMHLQDSPAVVATIFLVSMRLFGAIALAPGLGSLAIPPGMRVILAFSLSALFSMQVGVQSSLASLGIGAIAGLAVLELLIGTIIGLAVMIPVLAVSSAGDLVGMSMGIGFAVSVDPVSGISATVASRLYGAIAALAFLAAGGPSVLMRVIGSTFQSIPLGEPSFAALWTLVAGLGAQFFSLMTRVAAPPVIAALLAQSVVGLIGRTSPALNIFSIGFGLALSIGLATVIISWPAAVTLLPESMKISTQSIQTIIPQGVHP